MTIKSLHDRLVVELPGEVDESNKSHLIQLLKRHDHVVHSVVVAVGEGKYLDSGKFVPMEYAVGDDVYYPRDCITSAPRIKHDGKEYLSLVQDQILCYKPVQPEE